MLELNKVYNMDCLKGLKQLEDNSIDLVVTDPPYGIDFQSARRTESERFDKLEGDKKIDTRFIDECYRLIKDNSAIYLFTRWDVYPEWKKALESANFSVKNLIVWDRVVHGLGDLTGGYAPQHDFCIFATKGRHLLRGNRPKDILRYQRPDPNKIIHPTQKPVDLIRHLIKKSSDEGHLILDPYMGSGTTAIAAKQLGRNFIGFELSEDYYQKTEHRLKQNTMKQWFS